MRDLRLTLKFKYQVVSMRNMKKKHKKKGDITLIILPRIPYSTESKIAHLHFLNI